MNIITIKESLFALALIEKESAATVHMHISIDCFSENSPKETLKYILYADLLQSGAGPYSRETFQRKCDELGIKLSVLVANGIIKISLTALAAKVTPSLNLLEEMLLNPTFKQTELKRAVRTINNTLELNRDNARGIAHTLLKNTLVDKSSRQFGFLPDDLLKVSGEVTLTDIRNLHSEVMLNYWTVSIGGNTKSLSAAQKTVRKVKHSATAPTLVTTTSRNHTSRTVILHEVRSKQNIELSIGASVPLTIMSEDTPAFMFGLAVLGKWGGFSGRLMSTVREKEGLTYGIYAKTEALTLSETGHWRIMTFFAPKDVVRGITSTLREIKNIETKGITDSELRRFKTILKTSEALLFDSLAGTVDLVHGNLAAGLTWDEYQLFRKTFQTLTKKEVNLALKKYLNLGNLCISAAGPISSVKKDLEKFAK